MNNWFTVTVKYTKQLENGTFKRVTEPYLLAAMTFTDAEARIYEELGDKIRGEFIVQSINRTEVHDIFLTEGEDKWFKCKVQYEKMNDSTERGKKISLNMLITAESVKQANDQLTDALSTLMIDFQITQIIASPIVEIFPFKESSEEIN